MNGNEPEPDHLKAQRGRNLALALVLIGLVVLFFAMTIVRLGGNVAMRSF